MTLFVRPATTRVSIVSVALGQSTGDDTLAVTLYIPGFNVSWQAHVGGLVVGALVGLIYARTRSVRRRALQIWLLVALALVLLALLLIPPLLYY